MSATAAISTARRSLRASTAADVRERRIARRVILTWALLLVNVFTFYKTTWSGLPLVVPIPSVAGKLITQGALPVAFLVALTVNRRLLVRPNVFLSIASLLCVVALMVTLEPGHLSTVYRTFRLIGFIATLWLLTPWWGRRDLLLVRAHLITLAVVMGVILLGIPASPHTAYANHRLGGAFWPFPPTQVAHFSAILLGMIVVLWLCGRVSGRITLISVIVFSVTLLASHTRTALVAMLTGLFVAGLSLFGGNAKVRKLFAGAGLVLSIGAITLSGFVTTWLTRGENSKQLASLTGRVTVWDALINTPRNLFEVMFGFGMSNLSFNGLSIDSNWLGAYLDLGLVGAAIGAAMIVFLLASAFFRPRGVQRALALFLITYCALSSFTETGLSDPSLYLLELSLAASLLVQPTGRRPA